MKYVKGNLLTAPTEALVNTVNTVGVMGKGIALQFKEAFPANFKKYVDACKKKELQPGTLLVVKQQTLEGSKIIINFPTKTEWRLKSKYEYIEQGLMALVKTIQEYPIKSIAIPPLGCGNGGLEWGKVKALIEAHLGQLSDVEILVYEPNDEVKALLKKQHTAKEAKLTAARAMLLYAMFYYESMGEPSSLFVANKLAYFLQRLGETSISMKFEALHYGPYANQVEHMLHNVNGTYLKGLEQMNAKAFEPLELQYDKAKEISNYLKNELSADQRQRMKNLIELIDGFQSALSLEVLASVDFIKKNNPGIDQAGIIQMIHNWSDRKRKLFKDHYITIALQQLLNYEGRLSFAEN